MTHNKRPLHKNVLIGTCAHSGSWASTVKWRGDWSGRHYDQFASCCTKRNSVLFEGQCTNFKVRAI